MVKLHSKRKGIKVTRAVNPAINLHFKTHFIDTNNMVVEFLIDQDPGNFSLDGKQPKEKRLEDMDKDELLDLTARENIEADYKMSKTKLIETIKEARK